MADKKTDAHLDRALKSANYTPTGSNTYCNGNSTIRTDNNYYKESNGGWKIHTPGQPIKKK